MHVSEELQISKYAYTVGKGYLYNQVPTELWKQWYREKNALLTAHFGEEVHWADFYEDLFPKDSLQPFNYWVDENGTRYTKKQDGLSREQRWIDARAFGRGNAVIMREDNVIKKGQPAKKRKTRIVYDQCFRNDFPWFLGATEKALVAPVSFFGHRMTKGAAHEVFSIVLDIDYVTPEHLENLLSQWNSPHHVRIAPSYVVSSGRGLHLYFNLAVPVHLYRYAQKSLTQLKNGLVKVYWNESSSLRPFAPDFSTIVQSFRAVGSRSKLDFYDDDEPFAPFVEEKDRYLVRAWKCSDKRFTLEELNDILFDEDRIDVEAVYSNSDVLRYETTPIERAKELWPDWHEKMVEIFGEDESLWPKPQKKIVYKYYSHFVMPRVVFDNYVKKARQNIYVGGRYNTFKTICALGIKCSDYDEKRNPNPVTDEEIEKTIWELFPYYAASSTCKSDQFTRSDAEDALKMLLPEYREFGRHFARTWIEAKTKIKFPPPVPRRGRKRAAHIRHMNYMRDEYHGLADTWREGNGRPDKEAIVQEWKLLHPNGTKADCIRDTGLSKPTVYKWWNTIN